MLAAPKARWRHCETWPVLGAKSRQTNNGLRLTQLCSSHNALYVCTHNCTCAGSMPLSKGSFERRHSNDPTPLQPPVQFSVSLALFCSLGGAPLSWQGFSFLRWGPFFLGAFVLVLG